MTQEQVLARLKEILQADFRIPAEKAVPKATFRGDLGMDSLDAVDLIYLVSREFGIKADVDKFRDLDTVEKVVGYLVANQGQKG